MSRPKAKSSCNIAKPTHEPRKLYDKLEHRFSDLIVNLSLMSEDNRDISDGVFKDIKSCKNITFTRSKSYLDDIELHPVESSDITKHKHALLTSEEEDNVVDDSCQQSVAYNNTNNVFEVCRSPLKAYPTNALVTPESANKSAKKVFPTFLSSSLQKNKTSSRKREKKGGVNSSSGARSKNKENVNTVKPLVSSNVCNVDKSLNINFLSRPNQSPSSVEKTPVRLQKGIKSSTPINKVLTPNTVNFKTPISSNNKAKTQLSAFKRHSIDKAVASARQEFEEMLRTIKLKNSVSKVKQKVGNDSHLADETQDFSTNSTARNSLFNTPTTTYKTIETKTPLSENKSNCESLTGIKKLDKVNGLEHTVPQSLSCVNKDQTIPSEDDDEIPPTQPISSILLSGVVAYVEVRFGRDYMSEGTKAELESLGAVVEKNFTRKVTHCFFHGGKMSTYRKAVEWKIPLVSTLWIEACKAEMQMVPLKGYTPHGLEKYKEALPLYKLKTKGLRRAVTDSKIRRNPWKEDEPNKRTTQAVGVKHLPPAPIFKETDNVIDALHSVAGDLRKATKQFEKILTSPVLQKKDHKDTVEGVSNTSQYRKKRNKKLVFGSSSDDDGKKEESKPIDNETNDSSSKISDINDSEIRISYDSDDLLAYAKKQAANSRSSAPPRLLTNRKCKKLLTSCKDSEKNNVELSSVTKVHEEQTNKNVCNSRVTRRSKIPNDGKRMGQELSSEKYTQTKKRKLLLPSQVIANFEQDSGESTPPASPRCPYKATPDKKHRTGLALKSKTVRTLVNVKVSSDCESDDSLTRAARRESSALFVKKEKKIIHHKTAPTIVCTSLSRSDEDVVKSIVAQLGTFIVEGVVSERTTHVVTPAPRRTINLLKAIARGCWVLNVQWVYKSLEVGQWLPEERFELTEFSPAVKMARCDRQAFGPEFGLELFTDLGPFYVCRATVPPARDLTELLRLGGGCVVSSARAAKVVIGSTPPLSPCGRPLPLMVREKWVLDCITRLTRLDMADYIAAGGSEP